jgi:putative membrane-bound dehydrogenase-like protein
MKILSRFVLFLAPVVVAAPAAGEQPKSAGDLLGLDKVWSIHLTLSADEYAAMQPAMDGAFGAPPGPQRLPRRNDGRGRERNLFGTEFPWAKADVTIDGTTLKSVGVRYAGDITYFASAQRLKRPLKLQFDMFAKQDLHGLSALQLHAAPMDPSRIREAVALDVFRIAGVPAPRTAFAEVTLTVPGKHEQQLLGLYTVVEDVDQRLLADRLGDGRGLLMKPFRVRGIDHLGDDWERYKGVYNPRSEATKEQAKRVIDFARLVNQAGDDEFRQGIESFIDVDQFLRFLAANTLVSNLESFFALGHNYHLYVDPKTNKFVFIPGDLEFSFANFALFGSAEQQMDLSLTKPYPGENKLPDRLLAIKENQEKYKKIVAELSEQLFAKGKLIKDAAAAEEATRAHRGTEAKAAAARREAPAGFGPPGPPPPELRLFAEKRAASVAAQLAGTRPGFVPQALNFGPPGGGQANNSRPIDEATFRREVKVPPEFEATLFAAPPRVSYPVAIACGPAGEVFVAIDEQGSLGRTPGGGRVVRLIDKDGGGKADEATVFARMDHPRGLVYRNGSLWVMHPPTLSVFHDGGNGVADEQETLVTGLTTDMIANRGGDHTTNCVRMGIDGWLYIGVGDYGIKEARAKDGSRIVQRGGGVVRVRPDGTELEVYCTGLRNPFDLAIDPFLNLFTRDNTNDGGGWDTRVSLLMQTAHYGYTQLYANFTEEIMPRLGVFGGGGGTGGLFVQDPRWPENYRNTLFTGDWARSEVYRHPLKPHGATFDLTQDVFLTVPRATGMDIDANGRLYVASWRGGSAVGFEGPNIGFVTRVTPKGLKAEALPNLKKAEFGELMHLLGSPNLVARLHAQGEILSRGRSAEATAALVRLASDSGAALEGRVAAIFTIKQLDGPDSHPALVRLTRDAAVREFALRALTDRKKELGAVDPALFVAALSDQSPRVRAAALVGLSRLGHAAAAPHILQLTARPAGSTMPQTPPLQNQPDADRVIPHLAVRALVSLGAIDACLAALDGPHAAGALWALHYMHDPKAVDGLIKKLATAHSPELRRGILTTLIRLYHREADYDGSWWGIRPDSTGPYYDRVEWAMSKRIGAVITAAVLDGDTESVAFLRNELDRHQVMLSGLASRTSAVAAEKESPLVLPKADPNDPNQIGNLAYEMVVRRALAAKGDTAKGKLLFKSQSCVACHTDADGQTPKGPHLVDIGQRYKPDELAESILKPSAKLAQGFETWRFDMANGKTFTGFVVSERAATVLIREPSGVRHELAKRDIESRTRVEGSAMPDGLVSNLTPEQLADLIAYLQSLR